MGVRGLTTFIWKHSDKYLKYYELRDSYLIIDGNNIATQLYKWHCSCNDCFGGDYDKYAKVVFDFFKLLKDCNVEPLIVFDGGYEDKKLSTVISRMKSRIRSGKFLNPISQDEISMFPLFMRELFCNILLQLKLKVVRCDFEADYETACLARTLNCPVLSYDSDFYVFDVLYIPFSTMELNLCKKDGAGSFIKCKLYTVDTFLDYFGGMNKSNLPLMAALLGNDYIKRNVFQNFFDHIKLKKRKCSQSDQQRRIEAVITWLRHETFESALKKILERSKATRRKRIYEQIKTIIDGYACNKSIMLSYLNIKTSLEPSKFDENAMTTLVECKDDTASLSDDSEPDPARESDDLEFKTEEVCDNVPIWFLENYRKCRYPPCFMDIVKRKTYFCTPLVEDYASICSHHISVKIISAIFSILTDAKNASYVTRNEKSGIKRHPINSSEKKLPTLNEVDGLSKEKCKCVLLDVLEIEDVEEFPPSWQLYVSSLIFWIRNAAPQITKPHLWAIICCAITLKEIDPQVGRCRSLAKFLNKHERSINGVIKSRQGQVQAENEVALQHLLNINQDDCLICFKELLIYFQMDQKLKSNPRLYDVHIVSSFSQFQSVLLNAKHLNSLLNNPLEDIQISNFFNGTFIYNMCISFQKRTNLNDYVSALLRNSPTVLQCFNKIVHMLEQIVGTSNLITTYPCRKRVRKRKRNKNVKVEQESESEKDTPADSIYDVNNQFSILSLTSC